MSTITCAVILKPGYASGMKPSVSVLVFLVIKVPSRENWRVNEKRKRWGVMWVIGRQAILHQYNLREHGRRREVLILYSCHACYRALIYASQVPHNHISPAKFFKALPSCTLSLRLYVHLILNCFNVLIKVVREVLLEFP